MKNLDIENKKLAEIATQARDAMSGPRLGDYVVFPCARIERISYDWGDGMQTSPGGSFFLYNNGYCSFSGGLNPAVPINSLQLTEIVVPGDFWFFDKGIPGAGRGVYFEAPCRVYKTNLPYAGLLSKDFQCSKIQKIKELIFNT